MVIRFLRERFPEIVIIQLILMAVLATAGMGLAGCAAPSGIVDAAKGIEQPINSMANQFAVAIDALDLSAELDVAEELAWKLEVMTEFQQDLDNALTLQSRVVEWMEGNPLTLDRSGQYMALFDKIKAEIKKRKED